MSNHPSMRCESCGATRFKPQANSGLLVCEYCGAMTEPSQRPSRSGPVQSGSHSMRLVIFLVSSLLLVALIVLRMYGPTGGWGQDELPQTSIEVNPPQLIKQTTPETTPLVKADSNSNPQQVRRDPQWINQHLIIDHQVAAATRNGGRFWIFEISNQADEDMLRPGVTVSLFNADGQRVAEQGGWSYQTRLSAGEKTQVMVFIDEPPATATSETITPMASQSSLMADNQLPIAVKDHVVNEKNGSFEIVGDVLNDQTTAVTYPRVVVVAQDAAGRPIGLGQSFSTQKALEPEAISGFKVRVGTFLVGAPVSWHVYALAQKP
ncbi:hypothetical protein [Marinicella meishanensis]|uniref:hypothetical protein n=1 Tax=Marinicella meishanensis TaxID=2873263 RepID=UPI001CBD3A5C|nr:hypothetical protein [Marinicella sp. NBU2979]